MSAPSVFQYILFSSFDGWHCSQRGQITNFFEWSPLCLTLEQLLPWTDGWSGSFLEILPIKSTISLGLCRKVCNHGFGRCVRLILHPLKFLLQWNQGHAVIWVTGDSDKIFMALLLLLLNGTLQILPHLCHNFVLPQSPHKVEQS